MKRLSYSKAHKLPLLHEQLIAAGINPVSVEDDRTGNIVVTVADEVQDSAVQAVVDAHNPALPSTAETIQQEATQARGDINTQVNAMITRFTEIRDNHASLTDAQLRVAVRDCAIGLIRITRYLKVLAG